mgnify:CR=1 FL=1
MDGAGSERGGSECVRQDGGARRAIPLRRSKELTRLWRVSSFSKRGGESFREALSAPTESNSLRIRAQRDTD